MSKLVIIDGNAILHRAFHALPPLTTKRGEPINAVYGLVSMILRVITDLKPTHIAVTFDERAPTFRQKELPTYQAQRPPMAEDLGSQFSKAREFLAAANISVYSKPGFEADDVIGTIATRAQSLEPSKKTKLQALTPNLSEVIIVTGDRDQLQLVDDKKRIKLYMPVAGLINAKLYDEAETIERMGVPPVQITDLKALTGDASDNYFGVPGIGPKTAIILLSKYKSVKEIYEHLNEIPSNVREKLGKGKKSADQSYFLATIVRDVPLDLDFGAMGKWNISGPEVIKLFEEFGFKTLTKRIQEVSKKIEEDKQVKMF
ncbi:MAG: polymerase I protein [Candidatus Woesebacteria bacterium GW2011_GWA2_40_7b]|uniref:Polymerase I protein n=1 Tax=Candidatus Woesebacteria bacterium GW2011_GWA2_40_7b TaxID=1618563 RepID=A0A0G0VDK1_9BACT|nr:MAG: polymerase I protein [Candidatus Woesebacteria bacterium GW2011_GWA2_40_7b]